MEFSKKIITWVLIGWLILIPISVALMWKYGDLSPLIAIWGGLIAETATATGFYYWKAKAENIEKIKKNGIDISIESEDLDNGMDGK